MDYYKKYIKYKNKYNFIKQKSLQIGGGIEEYDDILSKNIVFVDLFDASANNTVLECIIRNTPIIINRLPAVVEYLGAEYPLYFNNLEQVNNLLNQDNLIRATEYLKNLDKRELNIEYFTKKIFSLVNKNL